MFNYGNGEQSTNIKAVSGFHLSNFNKLFSQSYVSENPLFSLLFLK